MDWFYFSWREIKLSNKSFSQSSVKKN
jgi:hypothetical protein